MRSRRVNVAGLVTHRQRPSTASGVVFATLEDETGTSNLIIWPKVMDRFREETMIAQLLFVTGTLQSEQSVIHVIAEELVDLTGWLGAVSTSSRDFR